MAGRVARLIGELLHRRAVARWRQTAALAAEADVTTLRLIRNGGRQLRAEIDVALGAVDSRLAHPKGQDARIMRRPGMDWAWRPELWSGPVHPPGLAPAPRHASLSRHGKVYHDCDLGEIALRQFRNKGVEDLSPFGCAIEVLGFHGTFLSLVIDLPEAGMKDLSTRHVLRLETLLEAERPLTVYARLNLRCGPNTEQIASELDQSGKPAEVEFDLAYADFATDQLDRAWIDLFFENPAMNRVALRDLTLSRVVRAAY